MSAVLTSSAEFARLLQDFFAKRLIDQQNASKRTIAAYRDSFKLLLNYAQRVKNKTPAKMSLADLDAKFILEFLNHLETERHNSVRTRNARLASIRAFANYISLQCPQVLAYAQQIQAIPMKRFSKPMLGFLTRDEIKEVLASPDTTTWCGRRDQIMISVLYNTGARVSEMINIRVGDLSLGVTSSVNLHGKGRKKRTVPLWKATSIMLSDWLTYSGLGCDEPLVPSRKKEFMSRTNVAERLTLAVTKAAINCPQLKGRNISPHIIRHYDYFLTMSGNVKCTVIRLYIYLPCRTNIILLPDIVFWVKDCSGTSINYQSVDNVLTFPLLVLFYSTPVPSSQWLLPNRFELSQLIHAPTTMQ